jgi:hypothetical protein
VKFISFLAAGQDAGQDAPAFCNWVLHEFAPALAPQVRGLVVNCVLPAASAPVWDIVIETWCDPEPELSMLDTPELRARAARSVTFAVDELVGKDNGFARGQPTIGVKLIAPWTGRDDVSRTEIRRHWDEHVPLANRIHIGCERYVRNWVTSLVMAPTPYPPAYQGIAFQYFASQQDLVERSFDKPESVQVITDDVADFLASCDVLVTREYLLKAPA